MALIPKVGTITKYKIYYNGSFVGYQGDPGVAGNYGGETTLYYIAEYETSGTGHWTGKNYTSYYISEALAWEAYNLLYPPVSIAQQKYSSVADEISQALMQEKLLESSTTTWSTQSAVDSAKASYDALTSKISQSLSGITEADKIASYKETFDDQAEERSKLVLWILIPLGIIILFLTLRRK